MIIFSRRVEVLAPFTFKGPLLNDFQKAKAWSLPRLDYSSVRMSLGSILGGVIKVPWPNSLRGKLIIKIFIFQSSLPLCLQNNKNAIVNRSPS